MSPSAQHLKYSEVSWKTVDVFPSISLGSVHLWRSNLTVCPSKLSLFWNVLSQDEKNRAYRFRFEKDRMHFIVARGTLRILLGKYLGKTAQSLRFTYSKYNKPMLENEQDLQFNISHAAGIGLFSFTPKSDIGVDLERVNESIEVQKLAGRFFSENEVQTIFALPMKLQAKAFFYAWTRKEAFIKGHGEGLSLPLDQFEVSILESDIVELKSIAWSPNEANQWSLYSFEPQGNIMGALAVKGEVKELVYLDGNNYIATTHKP